MKKKSEQPVTYEKCRSMMTAHTKNHMLRFYLILILTVFNLFFSGLDFSVFFYALVMLALVLLSSTEQKILFIVACCVIAMGFLIGVFDAIFGIPTLIILLTQIPEYKQAEWLKEQPGYPEFNERFDEQMENFGKEYQPDHTFDNVRETEMPDIPEVPNPDIPESKEIPGMPEITEMPGISEDENFMQRKDHLS